MYGKDLETVGAEVDKFGVTMRDKCDALEFKSFSDVVKAFEKWTEETHN